MLKEQAGEIVVERRVKIGPSEEDEGTWQRMAQATALLLSPKMLHLETQSWGCRYAAVLAGEPALIEVGIDVFCGPRIVVRTVRSRKDAANELIDRFAEMMAELSRSYLHEALNDLPF